MCCVESAVFQVKVNDHKNAEQLAHSTWPSLVHGSPSSRALNRHQRTFSSFLSTATVAKLCESKCRNITANLQLMREEFLDLHGHNKVSETQLSVARSGVNGLGFSWSPGSMTFCGAPAAAAATRRSRHRDALFPGSVDVGQVDLPAWSALLPNFLRTNSVNYWRIKAPYPTRKPISS